MIYRWIGKAVVTYGFAYARRRYGRQMTVAGVLGAGLIAIGVGAMVRMATKDVAEG